MLLLEKYLPAEPKVEISGEKGAWCAKYGDKTYLSERGITWRNLETGYADYFISAMLEEELRAWQFRQAHPKE